MAVLPGSAAESVDLQPGFYQGSGWQITKDSSRLIRRIGQSSTWFEDPAEVHLLDKPRMMGNEKLVTLGGLQ